MSLEQALNENTAAIKELAKIMAGIPISAAPDTATSDKPGKPGKTTTKEYTDGTTATGPGDLPNQSPAQQDAAKSDPAAEKPAEAPATTGVTYDDAKAAITALVKAKGRDAGLAVLATFGTDSALKVPEDDWQKLIDACNEALLA